MAHTRKLVEEELIRVATQCFSERGYQHTTLDDIVSQVGISRVTFYKYFESKAMLLKVICERSLRDYKHQLEEIMKQPLSRPERLRQAVALHIDSSTGEQPLMRLFFQEEVNLPEKVSQTMAQMHRDIDRLMEEEIKQGIARGEVIDANPRLLMYAFMGMCNWLYRWYRPGGSIRPEEIIQVFTQVLEAGCLTPAARTENGALAASLSRVEQQLQEVHQELGKVAQQLQPDTRQPRAREQTGKKRSRQAPRRSAAASG